MSIKKPDGESGFVIYFYKNSETSKYETDTYKYDSSWINFLNSAPLSGVKITDENIESYDWEKQRGWFTPFGDIMKKAS